MLRYLANSELQALFVSLLLHAVRELIVCFSLSNKPTEAFYVPVRLEGGVLSRVLRLLGRTAWDENYVEEFNIAHVIEARSELGPSSA